MLRILIGGYPRVEYIPGISDGTDVENSVKKRHLQVVNSTSQRDRGGFLTDSIVYSAQSFASDTTKINLKRDIKCNAHANLQWLTTHSLLQYSSSHSLLDIAGLGQP